MEVSYKKDAYHTYMVIAGSEEAITDDEEKMLYNQQSSVLLAFHVQQLNEKKDYYYDITGRLDFRSYIEKQPANAIIIEAVICFLKKIYQAVDEYLLNTDSILLDPSYIYMDMDKKRLYAAYVPGIQECFNRQLQQFAACLLENTDHKDKDGVLHVYDFYKMVRREDFIPDFLEEICKKEPISGNSKSLSVCISEETLKEEDSCFENEKTEDQTEQYRSETGQTDQKKNYMPQIIMAAIDLSILVFYETGCIQWTLHRVGLSINDGYAAIGIIVCFSVIMLTVGIIKWKRRFSVRTDEEDQDIWDNAEFENSGIYSFINESTAVRTVFDEDKTVVLSGVDGNVRLISLNKNIAADLVLTRFPCTVGNRETEAQAVIAATGISRRHALFEKKEDGIYLTDLNSTNGTRVNGEKLKKAEKRRLLVEDIIEFADVGFMYCGGEKQAE